MDSKLPKADNDLQKAHIGGQYRRLKTVAAYSAYFAMGCSIAIIGPSLPSMEVILGVDTKTISWALTGRGVGMLLGTISSGFIYSRISKELLFSLLLLVTGVSVAACTMGTSFWYFLAMLVIQGYVIRFSDAAGQCYMLETWQGHKNQAALLQGMNSAWSVGTAVGPTILTPFLVDLNPANNTGNGQGSTNGSHNSNISTNESLLYTSENDDVHDVKYGYFITACFAFVPVVLFVVAQVITGCSIRPVSGDNPQTKSAKVRTKIKDRSFHVTYLSIASVACFTYAFTNSITFSYIATYAVKALGLSNKQGGLATSAFFMGHMCMKLVCIYVFTVLPSKLVLFTDVIGAASTYALMLLSFLHISIFWISASFAGLFMATVQVCTILWVKTFVTVTGKVASLCMASIAMGEIVGPLTAGYIFDHCGIESFRYLVFGGSLSLLTCIVVGDVYSKRKAKAILSAINELDVEGESEKVPWTSIDDKE